MTSPTQPSAIVVGGSLAGLVTALSLSRIGMRVTVLERSGSIRSRGVGLLVEDRLVESVTGWGSAVPASLPGGFQSWTAIYSALRAAAEADPGVAVVHDARITGVSQDDAGAVAVTGDGRAFRADLLVGADGYRSTVRAAVAPDHAVADFAGYVVWLASIDERDLPAALVGDRRFDSGVFLSGDALLAAGPFPGPDGSLQRGHRTIGWAMYDNAHNDFLRANGNVRDGAVHHTVTADEIPETLTRQLARFIEARWPSPWSDAMLASLRAGLVVGTPIAEYVPSTLVRGRIALVGDAAHVSSPMTGRGFTEGLEDAQALAEMLGAEVATGLVGGAVEHALRRYEKKRLRRARGTVESGQRFSRRFGRAA